MPPSRGIGMSARILLLLGGSTPSEGDTDLPLQERQRQSERGDRQIRQRRVRRVGCLIRCSGPRTA